ncbi:MAG: hypothetical protein QG589_453 [Patescibacteria group bacterium]|nr:hypothetical protein [Patescibacteria group bacterium]
MKNILMGVQFFIRRKKGVDMYQIRLEISNPDTKFKTAGTARVRTNITSTKYNDDGSIHVCPRPESCIVATKHILTAKSKQPFVMFIGHYIIVASDNGNDGVEVLSRDNVGDFHYMYPSEHHTHEHTFF